MTLTVGYITSRPNPELIWFLTSLNAQATRLRMAIGVIVVDSFNDHGRTNRILEFGMLRVLYTRPKPTVWQGSFRLTNDNWWAASNARNTAICLCKSEWLAFVDDRCVLTDTWLEAVQAAMIGNYAVCGPYQKRKAMTVKDGVIQNAGIITGEDNRIEYVKKYWSGLTNPYAAPGSWWYGCSTATPLEWALTVGGYDETCDGLSGEDYVFGRMLENNGLAIKYDTRMMIIEDRSPEHLGTAMIRRDKGVSPNDKSHALLARLQDKKTAQHQWNLRDIRKQLQSGGPWPLPVEPKTDWYDGEPLAQMTPG